MTDATLHELGYRTYPDLAYAAAMPEFADLEALRFHRKWEACIGYRIFAALRWGQLGDGHISARDPIHTDHFWVLAHGVPFGAATVEQLVLVDPEGQVVDDGASGQHERVHHGINTAAYNIHGPILAANQSVVSAAHTHTPFGTPWSANLEPFKAISQEACIFVFDQSLYLGEDLEVASPAGGRAIAETIGETRLCILRNHGLLTVGRSPGEAVGAFVLAERVAEVHVKAPAAKAISDAAAGAVADSLGTGDIGWRVFQWLARGLVPDPAAVLDPRHSA